MFRSFLSLFAFAAIGSFVGCQPEEPAGGPGADVQTDDDSEPQNEEATFTASLGDESIDVAAGSEMKVDVNIERGEDFDQKVMAEITAPENITVTPASIEYAAGQETGEVTVAAATAAPVGEEVSVEIRFTPETGRDIVKQLTVMVVEPEPEEEEEETNDEDVDQPEIDDQE